MYLLFNAYANRVYQCDYEWYMRYAHVHIRKTESIWMVPGTVNPLD